MKPTKKTQPLRKALRRQTTQPLANAQRGRSVGDYNPQDAVRGAAKGSISSAPNVTPLPRPTGPRQGPRSRALRDRLREMQKGALHGKRGEQPVRGSSGGPAKPPVGRPEDRPRTHQTTRGKRRLSFDEAVSRRTTRSSVARVEELYGKKATPAQLAHLTENRSLAPGEEKLRNAASREKGNGPQNYGRGGLAQKLRSRGGKLKRNV